MANTIMRIAFVILMIAEVGAVIYMVRLWKQAKRAAEAAKIVKVETSFYDQEETFPDCTVQVLTNSATGETSVGWWKNE